MMCLWWQCSVNHSAGLCLIFWWWPCNWFGVLFEVDELGIVLGGLLCAFA